jgi:hypothetical protein
MVKGRRADEGFLSVIFTIELTTSWKAFINNEAIIKALSLYNWKIYDTEFQRASARLRWISQKPNP